MLDEIDRLKAELERAQERAGRAARKSLVAEANASRDAGDSIDRLVFRLRTKSVKEDIGELENRSDLAGNVQALAADILACTMEPEQIDELCEGLDAEPFAFLDELTSWLLMLQPAERERGQA